MKLKIVLGILGVLVVLLVVLVLVAGAHLGALVKAGMEKVGPKVTQTTLTVDSVDVSIPGGTAAINGLVLGNPQGYEAAQCIRLGLSLIHISSQIPKGPVPVRAMNFLLGKVNETIQVAGVTFAQQGVAEHRTKGGRQ